MVIKNTIIIGNTYFSWLSRCLIIALLIVLGLIAVTLSKQYVYQRAVDQFLSSASQEEKVLVIHTADRWITTTGKNKSIYYPLLTQELGEYRSHRFIGWHADYRLWRKGLELPFILLYEVTYDNAVTEEQFHFSGGLPFEVSIREVSLSGGMDL